jgi:hypothetical protein
MADLVAAAAGRVLADLADESLARAATRAFERRLSRLSHLDRIALGRGDDPLDLATTFEPDSEIRQALSGAVREHLQREVRFIASNDCGFGIELRTSSWRLTWTVAEYLQDLDEHLLDEVVAAKRPEPAQT